MRVVHLSYYYGESETCGAPIAATRLHKALLASGADSHFICVSQREPGRNIHIIPQPLPTRLFFYLTVRLSWILFRVLFGRIYMPNRLPLPGFLKILKKINPDVIHLHFIYQDMLALEQLEKLPYPLLIDLHDTLSFNPTDPYPGQDLRFMTGLSKANSNWMERYIFFRKKHLVDTKHPFFVGPSNWICNLFSQSLIGHGLSAQCIPNIIDPNFSYNPMMRRPHKDFTILFGASGGRSATLKGWNDLWESLHTLPDNTRRKIVINIFGENDVDFVSEGIRIHFLGRIRDPQEMCRQHHLADIFALPSKEDNAPQTKFEALSCGLPVIAFDRTGCAEFITHKVNGWIAPNGDLNSYATGILHYMDLYTSGLLNALHAKIADEAKNLFSNDAIVGKMLSFYSNCNSMKK